MSDGTIQWLLAALCFLIAWWCIDIALLWLANARDRRAERNRTFANRQEPSSDSPSRPYSSGSSARPTTAAPVGILSFQIEQGKILNPQPNGHAPKHPHPPTS